MKFGQFYVALPMFDPNDPGGAPAPAAPSSPAPAVGGNVGAPTPGAVVTPAVPAVQPQAPTGFNYKEDRSNWVPSHVVRQATEKHRQIEQQLQYERQRVAALSGVQMPAAPRNPEHDAIRNQLLEVMPELKGYLDMQDKLKGLVEGFDPKEFASIRESQNQSWAAQGNQTLRTLADKVKAAYGGAELPAKQLKRIASAFVTEIGEDAELRARYESGDMSIIDEFVADFTGGVLSPFQRQQAVAQQANRGIAARLPRGGGSSAVVGARPATLKPTDPDYHKAAFKRFEQ